MSAESPTHQRGSGVTQTVEKHRRDRDRLGKDEQREQISDRHKGRSRPPTPLVGAEKSAGTAEKVITNPADASATPFDHDCHQRGREEEGDRDRRGSTHTPNGISMDAMCRSFRYVSLRISEFDHCVVIPPSQPFRPLVNGYSYLSICLED